MHKRQKSKTVNAYAKALSDPLYRMRIVLQKKGKGSYKRRARTQELFACL